MISASVSVIMDVRPGPGERKRVQDSGVRVGGESRKRKVGGFHSHMIAPL